MGISSFSCFIKASTASTKAKTSEDELDELAEKILMKTPTKFNLDYIDKIHNLDYKMFSSKNIDVEFKNTIGNSLEIAKLNESKESFLLSGLLPSLLSEKLVFPKFLQEKESFYQENQQVLHFLNAKASRINALRKELLKTEMRIRQKNQFFQEHIGNLICNLIS